MVGRTPVHVREGETTTLTLEVRDYRDDISGFVVDADGLPVAGLAVTALVSDSTAGSLRRDTTAVARSDAEGRFRIGNLRAGEYEIATDADDRHSAARLIVRPGTDTVILTVSAKRMHQIEGTVTGEDGLPLAGTKVMPPPGSADPVSTDHQGRYTLTFDDGVRTGRRHLRFLKDGYQEARLVLKQGQNEDVIDVSLMPIGKTVRVSGRVTDKSGRGVAGERVQLHSPSRYTTYRTVSSEDGGFTMGGIAASNDYRVWVRPSGSFGDYRTSPVALTHDRFDLDIVLPDLETGTVHGRVVDAQHNPMPDFHFWVRSASAEGRALPVVTDVNGGFNVEQVPAGELTLGTRSQPQLHIRNIELTAGTDKYIEIVLGQAGGGTIGFIQ